MSVNPSASFSSLNFGKFLHNDLQLLGSKNQTIDEFALSDQTQDGNPTIGVLVKQDEKLQPADVLLRAVMHALQTRDEATAQRFIKQFGLQPKELPLVEKNGVSFYEFPVDADFYNKIEEFKAQIKAGDLLSSRQGISRANTLQPKIQIPEKLSGGYQKFLQENKLSDGDAARSRFLSLVKNDPVARARYTPVTNAGRQQVARETAARQTEAKNRALAAQINEGHNLRFGTTPRSTKFSGYEQQLYSKALVAYQAQDSEEFAAAFRQGKLLNLETFAKRIDDLKKRTPVRRRRALPRRPRLLLKTTSRNQSIRDF